MVKEYNRFIPNKEFSTTIYALSDLLELEGFASALYAYSHNNDLKFYGAAAVLYTIGKLASHVGLYWGLLRDDIAPLAKEVDERLNDLELIIEGDIKEGDLSSANQPK